MIHDHTQKTTVLQLILIIVWQLIEIQCEKMRRLTGLVMNSFINNSLLSGSSMIW